MPLRVAEPVGQQGDVTDLRPRVHVARIVAQETPVAAFGGGEPAPFEELIGVVDGGVRRARDGIQEGKDRARSRRRPRSSQERPPVDVVELRSYGHTGLLVYWSRCRPPQWSLRA
ncbi:hypothetical protein [Nonomuraea dietziae]|uniref:hypothetical protein n=1 Tax=Nonomuraea dietziae TaxID=65515 RepID=UPI0031D32FB4